MNKPLISLLFYLLILPFQSNAVYNCCHSKSLITAEPVAGSIDNQEPEAVCISQLNIELLAVTGTYILHAYDLESGNSSDNFTTYRGLKFSFSKNTNDKRRIFDCNDVGQKTIDLWVTDEAGNQSYCSTTVIITDTHDTCGLTVRSSTMS